MPFEDMIVLVTGATGAVGSIVTARFLARGARVAAVARNPERLAGLLTASRLQTFAADVTDAEAVERLFVDIQRRLGAVDILIHTVGGYQSGQYLQDIALPDWRRMLDLNLNAAFYCARHALAHMAAKGGKIITISALAAIEVKSKRAAYIVAKAGLIALTRVIAEEGKAFNVQANAIAPGIILTDANARDMPDADHSKWVKPDDIADLILQLCSPGAAAMTGSLIRVP